MEKKVIKTFMSNYFIVLVLKIVSFFSKFQKRNKRFVLCTETIESSPVLTSFLPKLILLFSMHIKRKNI